LPSSLGLGGILPLAGEGQLSRRGWRRRPVQRLLLDSSALCFARSLVWLALAYRQGSPAPLDRHRLSSKRRQMSALIIHLDCAALSAPADGIAQPLLGDVDNLIGAGCGKLRMTIGYAFFKRT